MTDSEHEGAALEEQFRSQAVVGGHRRRATKSGRMGACLPVLIVIAIVLGLLYLGVTKGVDFVRDQFGDPEDYAGPGTAR